MEVKGYKIKPDADLRDADLRGADLKGVNLRGVNLRGADLRGADLRGANLRYAILRGADLKGTDLKGVNLRGADLRGADLRYAILKGTDLRGTLLPYFQIPQEGALIVYKKLKGGVIANLRIPEDARRTATPIGRKCRAEYAEVLSLSDGSKEGKSQFGDLLYKVKERVFPDDYDGDIRLECTKGIHFFLTREEAEDY